MLARQAQPDVVLRKQHVTDPCVVLGLVPAEPEQLRRGESRERPVAGRRDEAVETDALLQLAALLDRALVVPEQRRSKGTLVGAQRNEAVHLTGEPEPERLDVERHQRLRGCSDPLVGILLGPTRSRRGELVAPFGARDDLTGSAYRNRFHSRRAHVEPDGRRLTRRHSVTLTEGRRARPGSCAAP